MKVLLKKQKTLEKGKLNSSRRALFHIKTRVSLKYFVSLYKHGIYELPHELMNDLRLRKYHEFV